MIATLGGLAVLVMLVLWKELKLFTFDPIFSHSLGFRSRLLDNLLIVILVIGVVIGIQSVGVVLMIALLVTPASAARQWTRQLGAMVMLAALIGVSLTLQPPHSEGRTPNSSPLEHTATSGAALQSSGTSESALPNHLCTWFPAWKRPLLDLGDSPTD